MLRRSSSSGTVEMEIWCGGNLRDGALVANRYVALECKRTKGEDSPQEGCMKSKELSVDTSDQQVVDVTSQVRAFASDAGGDGLMHVFAPHATAGLALMETGSGSERDLENALGRLLPRDDTYVHAHGSPGHGADHLLPVFIAPSLIVPVTDGRPMLGTWQSIVLVDLNRDNPRRRLYLSFLKEA